MQRTDDWNDHNIVEVAALVTKNLEKTCRIVVAKVVFAVRPIYEDDELHSAPTMITDLGRLRRRRT